MTAHIDEQTFIARIAHAGNSTYKKLAVQCLNEALCPALSGFSADRPFSASKSPPSGSCQNVIHIQKQPRCFEEKP
jgi:hypothetical protein